MAHPWAPVLTALTHQLHAMHFRLSSSLPANGFGPAAVRDQGSGGPDHVADSGGDGVFPVGHRRESPEDTEDRHVSRRPRIASTYGR